MSRKIKILKPSNLFYLFLIIHIIIWTLMPLVTRQSLHHDVLEGISQGLEYQLGYSKHPFFSMWVVAAVWQYIGEHDWVIYLFSQLLMAIGFFYIWKFNKALLSPWKALIATIIADGLVVFNINANILTPDTFQIPCWAAIAYYLYKLSWHPSKKNWMILSALFGLGLIIKYQILVLMASAMFFILSTPNLRKDILSIKYLYAIGIFLLIISPHLYWIIKTRFANFEYTYQVISHGKTQSIPQLLGLYLENTVAFCLPVIGIYLLTFVSAKLKSRHLNSQNQRLILCLSWGPWITTLILLFMFKLDIYARWMTPYFSFLGTFLMSILPYRLNLQQVQRFMGVSALGTLILMGVNVFKPNHNPHCDAFYPNKDIAKFINETWVNEVHQPLSYVGGSRYLVAAITPYIHPMPKPYFSLDQKSNPWIKEADFIAKGGVLVWDIQSNYAWDQETLSYGRPPENLKGIYPFIKELKTKTFYTAKHYPIEIVYAILNPHA